MYVINGALAPALTLLPAAGWPLLAQDEGVVRTCERLHRLGAENAEAARAWGPNDGVTVLTVRGRA